MPRRGRLLFLRIATRSRFEPLWPGNVPTTAISLGSLADIIIPYPVGAVHWDATIGWVCAIANYFLHLSTVLPLTLAANCMIVAAVSPPT